MGQHEPEPEYLYPLFEGDRQKLVPSLPEEKTAKPHRHQFVWRNILGMIVIHGLALYGVFLVPRAQIKTLFYVWFIGNLSSLGVQAGAHRLWCHRSYKANFGLRLFLAFFQTMALQNDIYEWCRDHRAHHRFSDTDGDPHNSTRGFFFSHVGWLLVKKHPDVKVRHF